jgi:pimeloyl-ACP methyl ester carboxylesterase
MRALAYLVLFVILGVAGLFLSGPYLVTAPAAESKAVPLVQAAPDLVSYLRQTEELITTPIKPGLEKRIKWANPETREITPYSIVYLHGWSSSSGDTAPYIDRVAKRISASVYFARFTAHGLNDGGEFARLKHQNLVDDAREALAIGQRIGHKVILIGMSTGATLATEIAFENALSTATQSSATQAGATQAGASPTGPSPLVALVLLSPNYGPSHKLARFASGPLGNFWTDLIVGSEYQFKPENSANARLWTTRYSSHALVPMMESVHYANSLDLRKVQIPVLVLYTHLDTVVSLAMMRKKFAQFGSAQKSMVDLPQADRHELVGDALAPQATVAAEDETISFLRESLGF